VLPLSFMLGSFLACVRLLWNRSQRQSASVE
jgi:hypothetical protein